MLHRILLFKNNIISILLVFLFTSGLLFSQLLDPSSQTKYVNTLPVIKDLGLRVDLTGGADINVGIVQLVQDLGLQGIPGYSGTTVWGYQFPGLPATYPGATIVAKQNKKVQIEWQNILPTSSHLLPVDASLHIAHPHNLQTVAEVRNWYNAGNIPVVTHLHGGHTESASDGLPEAWFTQGFQETGNDFVKQKYTYDNDQEAATLWYHDHALGITRLNVYAGLAGFYLLRDDNEEKLIKQNFLPGGDYEIEMVIQDRMFDMNGQLFVPAFPGDPAYDDFITGEGAELPEEIFPGGGPTVLTEFFGNFILVNGKAWPKLEVEPRKYRLRLLNGSDSRFYVLEFRAGLEGTPLNFLQISTDGGLLEKPVQLNRLLIAPGERMDVVVDFAKLKGQSIYLRNLGPDEPFSGGIPGVDFVSADINTTGQIMRFDVSKPFTQAVRDAKVQENTRLRKNIKPLKQDGSTRSLVLFEGFDEYGRLMPMLGTLDEGSYTWSDPVTENPTINTTEIWEIYNATMDAHPIHLHLVTFQILNREAFHGDVADKTQTAHNGSEITGGFLTVEALADNARDPEPNEKGWKDTAVMLPGEVTRVIATFDRPGHYVWHCHILSHEDHEMMRPYVVTQPLPKLAGMDVNADGFRLDQNYPNPFNPNTKINFSLPQKSHVILKIFDILGKEVATLINQEIEQGDHEVQFNADILTNGIYFYTISAGDFSETRKMVLLK